VKQPVGMHGTRLDVETHIITASISSVQNLVKVIRSIGVQVEDLVLEPLASGEAVLTAQERESGVIMADLGGGTTDIAVFKDGDIYHTAIIPVAGYQITSDIAIGLGLPFHVAERMKKTYGNVTPGLDAGKEQELTGIENGHTASYRELCDIVRSRMEELFELILLELPTTDYQRLAPCGLVLTGGTANLAGLPELGKAQIKIPCEEELRSAVASTESLTSFATRRTQRLWASCCGRLAVGSLRRGRENDQPCSVAWASCCGSSSGVRN